jgi:L-ribulose-5-phosphate 3-epimerase
MFKGITLRTFPPQLHWKECISLAAAAGFDSVEINFDGRLSLDISDSTLSEMAAFARSEKITIDSVYSRSQWATPISSGNLDIKKRGDAVLMRLIEIADALRARVILVIPGAVDNSCIATENLEITPYEEVYRRSFDTISAAAVQAERAGTILAIENVPGKFLLSPLEFRQYIEKIGSPAVGCYFDVANCLYTHGYPEDWIRTLGSHIKAVHLKDYRIASGTLSGFVNIFDGDVDWPRVAGALADTGYDLSMTSEVLPPLMHHPEHLWQSVASRIGTLIEDVERERH